jgi:hypothetical protein
MDKSRQKHFANWIVKQLKKTEGNTMSRQRLWHLFRVDPSYEASDTSAGFSVALKTMLNNGKVEIVFVDNIKSVKLR